MRTYWLGEGLRRYRACTALTPASSSSPGTACSSSGSPLVAMTACQPLQVCHENRGEGIGLRPFRGGKGYIGDVRGTSPHASPAQEEDPGGKPSLTWPGRTQHGTESHAQPCEPSPWGSPHLTGGHVAPPRPGREENRHRTH